MSGWLSTEATIARHAWLGLRGSLLPPQKSAFTYAHSNKFGFLALLLAVSLVPDAFVVHLLVPRHLWWLWVLLDLVAVYSLVWAAGIYGTMLHSPHTIEGTTVTVRRGLLRHASFDLDDVESVTRREKALDGMPSVEIRLRRPATVHRLFLGSTRATTLIVASDMPEHLIAALLTRRNAQARQ
jgi:hypothetical protein